MSDFKRCADCIGGYTCEALAGRCLEPSPAPAPSDEVTDEDVTQALGEMWEKAGEWSAMDRAIMRRVLETFLASRSASEDTGMRRFTVYRRGDLSATHNEQQSNAPDEAQFEGVVFTDGTVAQRWRTAIGSWCLWKSMDDLLAIHGHFEPRYGTEIVWHDAARRAPDTETP